MLICYLSLYVDDTSHQRITFRLSSSKSGPDIETGLSNSSSTAKEHVASNPIPFTEEGSTPASLTTCFVTEQHADQISSVDCS